MPSVCEGSERGTPRREPPSAALIEKVWDDYRTTRSARARDRLVVHYMRTHVRPIAERMSTHLPRQVDVEDLVQQGYMGLVESIERFDAGRDVRFETFSGRRIFGAMQDYLREIDPVPRLTRTRSKKLQAELERFQVEHGRAPDDDELRNRFDMDDGQFRKILAAGRPATMVSFSTARSDPEDDGDGDAMATFEDEGRSTPLSEAERSDLKHWLTRGFSRRDRLIIILYYFEKMTMKEIGRTIGCSESRVSQRLESILECLRSRLTDTGAEQEFMGK